MREWGLTPPLWRELSEADRDLMLAESALVCSSCGNLKSVCSQPGLRLYPQREECYVTAAQELVMRRLHKKYAREPGTDSLHALDGVSVWMAEADLRPDDPFFDVVESAPQGDDVTSEPDD